jgi:hypothetical protein
VSELAVTCFRLGGVCILLAACHPSSLVRYFALQPRDTVIAASASALQRAAVSNGFDDERKGAGTNRKTAGAPLGAVRYVTS